MRGPDQIPIMTLCNQRPAVGIPMTEAARNSIIIIKPFLLFYPYIAVDE